MARQLSAAPALPIAATKPAQQRALKTAREFEGQFLKSMLEQAFATVGGDGPLGGGGPGAEAWRSLLLDEHAKAISARGGIGIAPQIYQQIARTSGGLINARA